MSLLPRRKSMGSFAKLKSCDSEHDGGETARRRNIMHFEISQETVVKVGGIHQVLKSKASESVAELGTQYVMVGPYNDEIFQEQCEAIEPEDASIRYALQQMRAHGIRVYFGHWFIQGTQIQVLLFDVDSAFWKLDEWKADFWMKCHIGIPEHDDEANRAIVFGYLCCWFFSEFKKAQGDDGRCVAHFHEWLAAIGLILLELGKCGVATIFTTHATTLGRHLCAGSDDFYNKIEKGEYQLDKEAGDRQIYHKYSIERTAAKYATVFTTVSEITAFEAEKLLCKKVDLITPNGLNVQKYAAVHEFQNLHAKSKEKIHDFVRGHFYGHYDFDLDKTLYFFTAGRYEFKNKGGDLFIESLARLNHKMRDEGSDVTVIAFIIFPCNTMSFNVDTLKGQAVSKQIKSTVDQVKTDIGNRLYELTLRGKRAEEHQLLQREDINKLKVLINSSKRAGLPPICTHNVVGDEYDEVLNNLRRCQLFNNRHDRVKVIFHPQFIKEDQPLFGMDYYDFARGCHLGVFPSYYEPWGYTPAECTVMGIPSVTTNLSGFGCFMQCIIKDSPQSYGIYVVDRRHQGADGSVQDLAEMMLDFSHMSRRQRIIQRNRTERLSDILDWKQLGVFYRRAREMALHKKYPNKKDALEEDDEPLHMSRPASEPPSPTRSRSSTPAPSEVDSDDVDSDEEREELGLPPNLDAGISMLTPDHSPRSLSDMSPLLILDGPPGAPMPGDDIGVERLEQLEQLQSES